VTSLVQLRLLVAINSGTTDVRLESCRYKCNVRADDLLYSVYAVCLPICLPACLPVWLVGAAPPCVLLAGTAGWHRWLAI
jgi:hypothetical protein